MNETRNSRHSRAETVPPLHPRLLARLEQEPPVNRHKGYVYFVSDGECIKIGYSKYPLDRFKNLRSPSRAPMKLLAYFRGHMDEEHKLHRYFGSLLAHGTEWFYEHQRIHDLIATLRAYEDHLYARRMTILDVLMGRPLNRTKPDAIPTEKTAFGKWGHDRCAEWPQALQLKAGLYFYGQGSFEDFKEAYRAWLEPAPLARVPTRFAGNCIGGAE